MMTNEEIVKTLQPCSTALTVVMAALKDCELENVAARVQSIKDNLDLITQKLGGDTTKGI